MIWYLDYRPVEGSVAELYQAVFGLKGVPYPGNGVPKKGVVSEAYTERNGIVYAVAEEFPDKGSHVVDYLGANSPLTGDAFLVPTSFGKEPNVLSLPLEPMVEVRMGKNILMTPLSGKQVHGTVKELVSREDAAIRLSGVLLFEGEKGTELPVKQMKRLNQIFRLDESVQINNALLNGFGITRVVVRSLEVKPVERMQMLSYTMELLSDYDFELQLKTGTR